MNLEALTQASPVIQAHTAAALLAAAFGVSVLAITKGTALHKRLGAGFAVLMLFTAISSFWIMELRPGHFSLIHLLSILTLISIPLAIYYRRRGNIRAHAFWMISPLLGLLIAGGATLAPGRIMYRVFFG